MARLINIWDLRDPAQVPRIEASFFARSRVARALQSPDTATATVQGLRAACASIAERTGGHPDDVYCQRKLLDEIESGHWVVLDEAPFSPVVRWQSSADPDDPARGRWVIDEGNVGWLAPKVQWLLDRIPPPRPPVSARPVGLPARPQTPRPAVAVRVRAIPVPPPEAPPPFEIGLGEAVDRLATPQPPGRPLARNLEQENSRRCRSAANT